MDDILRELCRMARSSCLKLYTILKEAHPIALPLTGLLGIVAVIAGFYHFRALRRRNPNNANNRPPRETTPNTRVGSKPGLGVGGVESNSVPIPLSDLRSQLPDVKKVTISAPGVLLEEWEPEKLEKGATIKPDAAEIIKELASSMHVYILAHVESEVGETAVRAALEAGKILGQGIRQLPSHRLVFCETLKGKVSIVRQIEPELHVDGNSETLEDLQRFIPFMFQVVRKGQTPAACKTSLVACGPTLADAMNVQVFS